MTYKWFIDETEQQLGHLYESTEGRAIAARLLQHFCGVSSYEHLVEPYGAVAEEYLSVLQNAVQQLAVARPLQYVIGCQEFLGRDFFVEEGVLIPRPETEELVLWVMEYIKQTEFFARSDKDRKRETDGACGAGLSIIDAACGSGAIAVSLAASLPGSQIYAFDLSDKALEITRRNSEALLPAPSRIRLFKYDLLGTEDSCIGPEEGQPASQNSPSSSKELSGGNDPLCGDRDPYGKDADIICNYAVKNDLRQIPGQVDIIVSNPPYVTNAEKAAMRSNVLDYEPEEALFVPDDDPLIFYKALERFASKYLKPGGVIFMEINEQFGAETVAVFEEAGYTDIIVRQDIFGKDRMICAQLSLYSPKNLTDAIFG